jgi:hypothetical protein
MEEDYSPEEPVSLMVDDAALASSDQGANPRFVEGPPTPINSAANAVPLRMDPTLPSVSPAHTLQTLCAEHDALRHVAISRTGTAGKVRDPGFAALTDPRLVLGAIVGVFNTAGYSLSTTRY